MEIIYVDSLFFFDLMTDYLLCLLTARFCALRLRRGRYLLASLLGAAYSVAVFLPGLSWLGLPLCRIAAAGFIGLAAFGAEERLGRCIAAYIALSAACGGMLYAVGLDRGNVELWRLCLLFLGCYGFLSLLSVLRSSVRGVEYAEGDLVFRGKSCPFRAIVDTGNRLHDPVSGGKVILLSPAVLAAAIGETAFIPDPVELLSAANQSGMSGVFRLIPFSSVGGSGMLAAFTADRVTVGGKEYQGMTAAISHQAAGDGFNAIF